MCDTQLAEDSYGWPLKDRVVEIDRYTIIYNRIDMMSEHLLGMTLPQSKKPMSTVIISRLI